MNIENEIRRQVNLAVSNKVSSKQASNNILSFVEPIKKPGIDGVFADQFKVALNLCGMDVEIEIADKIIDIVELMEEHGNDTSLSHIAKLHVEWEESNNKLIQKPNISSTFVI